MFTPVLCWCCNYILHRGLHIVYFFSVALVIIICPPEGQPAWLYSVTYNATYMVPETIVTIVVGVLIALVLDFRKDTVGALKRA